MLLINPATEKFGGFLSRYVPVGIPVAIGCIAAYLEERGVKCNVIDEELYDITPSVLADALKDLEKPYIVGLTCLTAHVGRAYQIAAMVKEHYPDATVMVGGLHPTALPEEALAQESIDFVVRGEGEEIAYQLCKAIHGDGTPENILGVSYMRDGELHSTPDAPLLPNINDIPQFPYHLFENPKYDMGFMTTSRGCPYRCSYCSQRLLTGTTYRYRSAENIVNDLELLVDKYHQDAVVFYDDNFCLNARRVHELCDLLVERGLDKKVKLSVQTRADNVLLHGGEELVKHMAESGFNHMGFGLETGVQRLTDLIRKDETVDCHLETTKLCQKHGIDVSFFMIFGLPTETKEDREYTFNLVQSANVVGSKYNNLIPYPGTPLYKELENSGRMVVTKNWANLNSVLAMTNSIFDKTPLPYVPDTCSEFELKREIIRYNIMSYVNMASLAAIFGHSKGLGWFMLPKGWYKKPREVYEIGKIGFQLGINTLIAYLPLWTTEWLMNALNPEMRKRPRIPEYDPSTYVTMDWDSIETKNITKRLKVARDEQQKTGKFSVISETT